MNMAPKKNKSPQAVTTAPPPSVGSTQPPNWPPFSPLIPETDLALTVLVPNQIVTIPNLWTASLCKTYVSFLSSLPLTTTPGKPKKGEAVRVNDRFQVDDAAFAERLWSETALKHLITGTAEEGALGLSDEQRKELWGGEVVGLNPNIRIYRYSKGQFFDQHYDDSNNVTIPRNPPVPTRTTWTLLLYLTSPTTGCIGGETVFYPDPPKKKSKEPPPQPITVGPQVGLALLHRHGADCMLHEGREVTGGEKWVIRSDLCVKR
ncbi:Prolyl 4-hydroxylase alpha subunit [Pyrenophora seminiperda CCB06]|uniref:Prolyl 4-hydroxylase alpha subunit n=1 Tax=Pyrenophora seminiperda CCB06 TaxID=1302712 RepID=A0A3M7LZL7_9PLEO|nr:Prolyl 4-hydroxylase alpha subunit [Pyrenophora seminiperda CCB06]